MLGVEPGSDFRPQCQQESGLAKGGQAPLFSLKKMEERRAKGRWRGEGDDRKSRQRRRKKRGRRCGKGEKEKEEEGGVEEGRKEPREGGEEKVGER